MEREPESLDEQALMEDPPEYQHPDEDGKSLAELFDEWERNLPE